VTELVGAPPGIEQRWPGGINQEAFPMRFVSALSLALMFLFGATVAASAHVRHRYVHHFSRHRYAYRNYHHRHLASRAGDERGGHGLVHEQTAAGQITVASDAAGKFKELIAALVAKGFKGDVHCYASGGHVTHSLHYSGRACDFAQTGRNRTVSIMYHAGSLIKAAGLRDGCSFHDCGHVDTGFAVASRHERHYAVYAQRRHEQARYRYAAYGRREAGSGYSHMMMYAGDMLESVAPRERGRRGRYHVAALTYQRDRLTPQ
jgi:hypothetical protein